ncbi:MAG: peptidase M20 [Bacteroides sp. SM23_62]|nr:MAG: peptidase M20 [Bacteroides sp. SM23_62]
MLGVYLSLAVLAICAASNAQLAERIDEQLTGNLEQHEGLYKHFHQYPELSFKEFKTSEKLSDELERLGFKLTRNVGGNGFVGLMQNGPGPVIMIRTDLDALPLEEKTGLSYASKVIMPDADGIEMPVMHACGHDMHMTVWLGTAKVLAVLKEDWRGTLMMVAQQAEEKSGGADAMIADGLFTRFPLPDYALAYHVSAELPAGTIGYRPGPFLAGVSSVDITVHGVGGHGALPHLAVDPVVLASRMVLAFQTIPSREINPLKPAVVTVGSIHGGTVHNIIPDEVKMQLTVRYYDDETYGHIISALQRITSGIAGSAGLPENLYPEVTPLGQTPPVVNDAKLTEEAVASFSSMLGPENVIEVEPVTAGEDFARYGRTDEKVPIAMFWLGTVNREKFRAHIDQEIPLPGLHNPAFYPDFAPTYKTGVSAMAKAVIDLFNK